MTKRPFLLFACMLLAGILAWKYRAWWLFFVPFLLCLFVWKKEEGKRRILLLAFVLLFFAAGVLRMGGEEQFRSQYLPKLRGGDEVRLVGEITRIEEKSRCVYLYLTDCALSYGVACNDVLAYASAGEYSIGQILVLRGKIELFEGAPNEGGFDEKQFYQSQRIDFGLWVDEVERVAREPSSFKRAVFSLRERLVSSIEACGGKDGVLTAMLLGEKSGLDGKVKSLYKDAGISHILAISGLHVSMLGLGLYHLLRRLGLRYFSAGGITAVFLSFYGLMTGWGVSTRRAVGMLFVLLVADVLGRGYDLLNALGILCTVLLWENPYLIGYSGFWFSVVAVLGVGGTGSVLAEFVLPAWEREKEPDNRRRGLRERAIVHLAKLGENLLVSLGIQLTTLPLVAYCYYEIPVYALLLNTVVLALLPYLFGVGCAAAVAGLWSVGLGTVLMTPCNWILALYELLCERTLDWPMAQVITGKPAVWQIAAYYGLLALVLYVMHRRSVVRKQRSEGEAAAVHPACIVRARLVPVAAAAVCSVGLFLVLAYHSASGFAIDVLDVGQGDGICLRMEDGTALFLDGGSTDVSAVGTYRILPFLKYNGIRKISYWFVSHTDEDHVSGLKEVLLSGYSVDYVVFAEAVRTEEKTLALAALAEDSGTKVFYMKEGDSLASESATLRCLYPGGGGETVPWSSAENGTDINDLCLVLWLECGDFTGIFTGDISAEVEEELVRNGRCAEVDFYKAAHHGSKYSNSSDFLQELTPRISVISCGENNRYGHPGAEAVAHMEEAGSEIYYTMYSGQIRLRLLDGEVCVEEVGKR